ncbi:hypothetical protein [Thermus sp.]|jgi:hypothetical protein|uniref:hypothetical protein n=1 Tax=Thermus sp. TaxID=275 RepID=UPI00321FE9A0
MKRTGWVLGLAALGLLGLALTQGMMGGYGPGYGMMGMGPHLARPLPGGHGE